MGMAYLFLVVFGKITRVFFWNWLASFNLYLNVFSSLVKKVANLDITITQLVIFTITSWKSLEIWQIVEIITASLQETWVNRLQLAGILKSMITFQSTTTTLPLTPFTRLLTRVKEAILVTPLLRMNWVKRIFHITSCFNQLSRREGFKWSRRIEKLLMLRLWVNRRRYVVRGKKIKMGYREYGLTKLFGLKKRKGSNFPCSLYARNGTIVSSKHMSPLVQIHLLN